MDYASARTAFLTAPDTARPAPPVPDTPARRLRDAAEPLATMGIWSAAVNERYAALGLDFLTGYVWGRAAAMGEPGAPVVVAAFGVFAPDLVTAAYEQARGRASREQVLAARAEGTVESLHALLRDADVDGAVEQLRRAVDALAGDLAGRPLFAGLLALPWPADRLGRLWRAAELLREYRGDVHQAATVAAGLSGLQANLMTEHWIGWAPTSYAATRGWSAEALAAAAADLAERGLATAGGLTEEGRRLRTAVEQRTDAALAPALAAIGPDLPELVRQLDRWSAQITAGGQAPPDLYKRLSG